MRSASPASPAGRTLIATARFKMESCGRDKLHLSAIGDQRRYFVHEVSKALIRQSIALNFATFGQAYLFITAHYFPNSSAIFSAIFIVGAFEQILEQQKTAVGSIHP